MLKLVYKYFGQKIYLLTKQKTLTDFLLNFEFKSTN